MTNWSLWWAAAKAKLCFGLFWGGRGTAIKTDRNSPVVPSPVYLGSCVGNTASVFNDRFQAFIRIRLERKLTDFRIGTDSKTANCALRVAVQPEQAVLALKTARGFTERQ